MYEPRDRDPQILEDSVEWTREEFWSISRAIAELEELMAVGRDFYFDVAAKRVAGHASYNKFGANANIAAGAVEEVWSGSGSYTFSTSADITHIVSTVAETQLIEVQGLDTDWNLVVQTKTLTGATRIALDTPLRRVFRMRVTDPTPNAGAVECGVGGGTGAFTAGNLRARIEIGLGKTLMAIYTVPAGKTGYVQKYYGSMIGSAGPPSVQPDYVTFRLWCKVNDPDYAPFIEHVIGLTKTGDSVVDHHFDDPEPFPEKTDIWMDASPDGDAAHVAAGFDLILVDN